MSDMVVQKNIAAVITPRLASAFTSATAGGSGDATQVVGTTFQRSLIGMPLNAAIILAFSATLTAAKTLSLGTVAIYDSADGTTFASFQTFTDPGIVLSATGAGQVMLQAYLEGARDYVRVVFTPDLSATATDTATIAALLVFAGERLLPAAA